MRSRSPFFLIVLLAACKASSPSTDAPPGPPTCAVPLAVSTSADPNVFATTLTAAPLWWKLSPTSTPIEGAAYNGTTPGATIVVTAGQTIRVDYQNQLAEDTTIHWHGMRVPWAQDGVPNETQAPVPPQSNYLYQFTAPDPGLYWYHPHMSTSNLVDHGLYGMIVVKDPAEPPVDCDLPVALDDAYLGADGQIEASPADMRTPGHLGNVLYANGQTGLAVPMHPGGHDLLRFVNTSNARYFDLTLEGHTFEVVGTDGGFVPNPWTTDELIIAPGERYEVLVEGTGQANHAYRLVNHRHDSSPMEVDPLGDTNTVMWLVYDDQASTLPAPTFPAPALPVWTPGTVLHEWVLDDMTGVPSIDGKTWPNVPVTQVPVTGQPITVSIRNNGMGAHPMHFHGERLLVMRVNGTTQTNLGWKDTIDVPAGATVTLVSDFSNLGNWMFHCHILEHAEDCMAAEFNATAGP